MANREQLRRLKVGVEGWNAGRQENPDVRIDLRGAKLKGLAALFEMFAEEGVEGVLLNACYSKAQAQAIRQHIPHVIGMNQTITDKAGIEFAVAFYDGLGAGKDVNFAFKLAQSQLIPFGEHKIPELLSL